VLQRITRGSELACSIEMSILRVVRFAAFDLALCAISLWVGVSSAGSLDKDSHGHGAQGGVARAVWDRQALWARAAAPAPDAAHSVVDRDGDGIDDAAELALAKAYFPYYSLDSRDGCSRHGVVFRLAPHPSDSSKLAIWYVVLYERDCGRFGLGGHVGDDEGFSAVIDPKVPPPAGILALRAISHQNTLFERETNCGSLPGSAPCGTADIGGKPYPVVFASASKHGQYVSELACNTWPNDLAACSLEGTPDEPPFVNAGEPGKRLCDDLTRDGFVTPENGWAEPALMHFDPWANQKFGKAGNLTEDLTDRAFLIAPSG
jgi:hypothetical protein